MKRTDVALADRVEEVESILSRLLELLVTVNSRHTNQLNLGVVSSKEQSDGIIVTGI